MSGKMIKGWLDIFSITFLLETIEQNNWKVIIWKMILTDGDMLKDMMILIVYILTIMAIVILETYIGLIGIKQLLKYMWRYFLGRNHGQLKFKEVNYKEIKKLEEFEALEIMEEKDQWNMETIFKQWIMDGKSCFSVIL